MCNACVKRLDKAWPSFKTGTNYMTPCYGASRPFHIQGVNQKTVRVNKMKVPIPWEAFLAVLNYLCVRGYACPHCCTILSNNSPRKDGPLSHVARLYTRNVRSINYILPILATAGIVGINGTRPTKTCLT